MSNDLDKNKKVPNVPNLRFNSFSIPYNEIIIGTQIIQRGRRAKSTEWNLPAYSINNSTGFTPQEDQWGDASYTKLSKEGYKYIEKGDFAYNPARINVGSIGLYKENEPCIVSSLYVCFKTKPSIINDYLYIYLKSEKFNKKVLRTQEGGVRTYFFYDKLEKTKMYIPSLEEQVKISSFLNLLDARIQTQNKIIEALKSLIKQLKTDSFNKMESNANSYYFEDLFKKYSKNNNLNYPQYTIGKYGIKNMEQSKLYSIEHHIVFEPNSLILGIGIEECGVSKDLYGCCSPIYKTYKINNKIIKPDFVDLFIKLFLEKKKNFISQKSTRREYEIVYSLLDKTSFSIPSINEQEKILIPIKKLIEKLNLEKEILNKYVDEKNYLLANLFI